MGVVCTKVVEELGEHQKKNKKGGGGDPPNVHDVIMLPSYRGVIGKVHAVSDGKCSLSTPGPNDDSRDYDWNGAIKVDTIPELNRFMIVDEALSGAVTVMFRGAECHGWITHYDSDDKKITVSFRPDAAHKKVDSTDFDMGDSTEVTIGSAKKGHVAGASQRPRDRTAAEITAEKNKVKSYGVAYIHCAGCGTGVWDNPCDCFPTQKRKGYFCQECGKKCASGGSSCCGSRLSEQAQNQGWARTLGQKYGYFE